MKHTQFILIALYIAMPLSIKAQVLRESKAKIDNIDFELIENKVVIRYDLENAKDGDRFDILVGIFKATSDIKIDAKTFSGDIYNQASGKGKVITWELANDISYLNDNIYVMLEAKHLNPVTIPFSSKKTAFIQSTAFPGWGTSKITMNKAHLVKGVAAYALIGLSIKSNYDAASYYEKYKEAEDSKSRDDYFKKAETSYQNSFYFIGGAAAIWLGEYLWIYLAPNKTDALEMAKKKISMNYNYIPSMKTPVLTLIYKF